MNITSCPFKKSCPNPYLFLSIEAIRGLGSNHYGSVFIERLSSSQRSKSVHIIAMGSNHYGSVFIERLSSSQRSKSVLLLWEVIIMGVSL